MANYKNIFKTAALGMALAAVSQAQASTINVGGVFFDPENFDDFFATDTMYEKVVSSVGDELKGYGKIVNINNETNTNVFCPSCELTYTFGGFTLNAAWNDNDSSGTRNAGDAVAFSGGWINLYVDGSPDFAVDNIGSASDGTLWMSLTAHTLTNSNGLTGTLFSTLTQGSLGTGTEGGNGISNFDVVVGSGVAAPHFDTNGEADGSDFRFQSSFGPRPCVVKGTCPTAEYKLSGSNDIYGNSVPEPASIALLGAGLLGMGVTAARRRKSA